MTDTFPPKSYEDLIRVIHDRYEEMSKTYQKIAVYLTQNPNDVAVMSVNAIGEKTGIHASSFVRYAQSLGFRGFKELQAVFQRRLTTAAPGFDARIKALEDELGTKEDRSDLGFLRDLVVRDVTSLQDLLANISAEQISKAADLMEAADTIYLLGQLRSAPVVDLLRYALTMLGKRTVCGVVPVLRNRGGQCGGRGGRAQHSRGGHFRQHAVATGKIGAGFVRDTRT
jgi:DNA-binding MurR/RpiR family transcriptional regulator